MDAQKYAEEIGLLGKGKFQCQKNTIKNFETLCFPRKHVKYVTGTITHVSQQYLKRKSMITELLSIQYETNFNRFWLRSVEEERLFNEIQLELNSINTDIAEFTDYGEIQVGQVVAAPHDGGYYRAKVLLVIKEISSVFYNVLTLQRIFDRFKNCHKSLGMFQVLLMDIGREGSVEFSELRRLRGVSAKYIDVPPRVFECRLACVQPSELHSARYEWESIMTEFKKLTCDTTVYAEVRPNSISITSLSISFKKIFLDILR